MQLSIDSLFFQKLIHDQRVLEAEINKRLEASLRNDTDLDSIVTKPWKTNASSTSATPESEIVAMGLRQADTSVTGSPEIDEHLDVIENDLEGIEAFLEAGLPPIEGVHRFNKLIINGNLEVHGESSFVNADVKEINGALTHDLFKELVR